MDVTFESINGVTVLIVRSTDAEGNPIWMGTPLRDLTESNASDRLEALKFSVCTHAGELQ